MKAKKTPAECIGSIINAGMGAKGLTADKLASTCGVHYNTVRKDLKDPDSMQLWRMWLYFVALQIPIDEGLQTFADAFARSLVIR